MLFGHLFLVDVLVFVDVKILKGLWFVYNKDRKEYIADTYNGWRVLSEAFLDDRVKWLMLDMRLSKRDLNALPDI